MREQTDFMVPDLPKVPIPASDCRQLRLLALTGLAFDDVARYGG